MRPGIFLKRSVTFDRLFIFALAAFLVAPATVTGQPTNRVRNTNQSLAEVEIEMTNAFQRVAQIVNKPVRAFARTPNLQVSVYSPGWFHDGASKPEFNTVDIRQSQEFPYASNKYVTSDLNPNVVFLGADLEFNAMTKFFYTNRTLPKRKLTEAEMVEINQLYRVLGKCERAILPIQKPPPSQELNASAEKEEVAPDRPLAAIRAIPQEKRILYGAIAVSILISSVLIARLFRKKA